MNNKQIAALLLAALVLILAIAPRMALATNGHQEGYPPPLLPTPTLAVPVEAPEDSSIEPYPSSGTDFSGEIPVPIGIESGAEPLEGNFANEPTNSALGDDSASSRGIIFLWLSFVATLLVFLTSVFGSIILFTRRNES